VPEPYKMVSVMAPRVSRALMPGSRWYRLDPVREKSVEPVAARALMDEQFKDGKLADRLYRMVQQGAKYGTMIAKVPWVIDRREVKVKQVQDRETFNAEGQLTGTREETQTLEQTLNHDRTELRPINIFDAVFDWRYDDAQLTPCISDYSDVTREFIYDMMATDIRGGGTVFQGITRDEVEELNVPPQPVSLPGKDLQQYATNAQMIERTAENDLKMLDWWGLLDPYQTGKREEYHVIILNDKYVVHIAKNNLWHGKRPYLISPWEPVENELYGIGVIEMIVRLCLDLNDNQNALNVGTALSVNPMVKAGDGFNIPDQQFTTIPGRVLRGGDVAQLQPFVIPDTSRIGRDTKEDFRRDIDETVGAPRGWVAGLEEAGQTATEFAGKQRAANIRVEPVIIRANANIMQPFLDMSLYNNQQFLEETRTVHYSGNAGQYFRYKVTPKELAGIARVRAMLPPQIELMGIRGQQMMAFMGAVAQLGPLSEQEPFRSMLKISYTNQFGHEDAERIWPEEVEKWRPPQREELIVMLKGTICDVNELDNHAAHIEELASFMESGHFGELSPEIRAIVNAHYLNHEVYFRRQEELLAQQQQLPGPGAMEGAAAVAGGGPAQVAGPQDVEMALEGILEGRGAAEAARGELQGT